MIEIGMHGSNRLFDYPRIPHLSGYDAGDRYIRQEGRCIGMRMPEKLYRVLTDPFRRSIRNKLILTMIILCVLPIIAISVLAAENSRKSMESEVIDTNLSNMKWTGFYLDEKLSQLNNLIYSVLISPQLNDYMTKSEDTSLSSQFAAQKSIVDTLTSTYYSAGNHVVGIQLYLKESNKLFTINASQSDIESPIGVPSPYSELFDQKKDFVIQTSTSDQTKFEFIRSINRFENQEKLGGISLAVQWAMLDQTLTLLGPAEKYTVLIAGPDGRILYQLGTEEPSSAVQEWIERPANGVGYVRTPNEYLFYNSIEPRGLKLVKIIPASSINRSAQATMRYGFIVGAVSVGVSIMIAIFLAWRMARPIVSLARSMQGLGLIKDTEVPLSNRIDEIGLLETKLHNMSHRIREHIKTEYSMDLEKKTAELKALQAQINPHFLQNTLQMIGSMLFSKNPSEIYEIIKSLSDMFRYVIREPDDLASIQAEIDHLNNYMQIQNKRFSTRLRYTIEVDEDAIHCKIPKLTLQPIAENAFIHGLNQKSGDWELNVLVVKDSSEVCIVIRDNGIGMNQAQLTKLRMRLENQTGQVWTSGSRIGLSNVASRIRMHFGSAYGIKVESEPSKGTLVTVRIPFGTEGEARK